MPRRIIIASLIVVLATLVGPAHAASRPAGPATPPTERPALVSPVATVTRTHRRRPRARPPAPHVPRGLRAASPGLVAGAIKASCQSGLVHDLIVADFPASQVTKALTVASRESSCYPYAKNPTSTASGVFQFLASTWASASAQCGYTGASVFGARANVAVAACYVAKWGWGAWGG